LPGSRIAEEAAARGISTLLLPVKGYLHPLLTFRLARVYRSEGFDLVHCHLSRDIATVIPARQLSRTNIPVVLSKSVGSYIQKKDLFHRYTYGHLARVLAISSVIRRNVLATTSMPPGRVLTLHFPVDTTRFDPAVVDRRAVRDEFGIAPDEIVAGFVGRFSPGKGHEELLAAASMLADGHPELRFVVVGEASHGEEEYAQFVRESARVLTASGRLLFTGFRKDVPALMAAFDLLVFPSHAEAFGMVLIEAMAMERPVVSTNCDGVLDIVGDGETGLLVPPKDAHALAAAIERLLADSEARKQMGRAGRRRVISKFEIGAHLRSLEEIYRRVIEDALAPPDGSPHASHIPRTV
jgi:glycosyltransferase involved in cell wall biosynthesis